MSPDAQPYAAATEVYSPADLPPPGEGEKKSFKLFHFILLIEAVLLFSFLASYLILSVSTYRGAQTGLFPDARSPYQSLYRNYNILKNFLRLPTRTTPVTDIESEVNSPFVADILKLKAAATDLEENGEKNAAAVGETLLNLEFTHKGNPYRKAFLLHEKNKLYLKYLALVKNYDEFIAHYDSNPDLVNTLTLKLTLINSYIKAGNNEAAFTRFSELFARNRIKPFEDNLTRQTLTAFLKQLDYDYWFKKFKYLARNNQYSEFLREEKYIKSPQLTTLFQAEFSYQRKQYDQSRRFLDRVKDENLQPYKNRILFKLDLREKKFDPTGFGEQLLPLQVDPELYHEVLLDAGNILLVDGELELALEFFKRYETFEELLQYIYLIRSNYVGPPGFIHPGADYWKTLWVSAWLNYNNNNTRRAVEYFRKGLYSPITSYRVASQYWLQKLEKNNSIIRNLDNYPFTYYYTRDKQPSDFYHAQKSLQPFIQLLNHQHSPFLDNILDDLTKLVRYNLLDEAVEFIRWLLPRPELTPPDRHLLRLIESIVFLKKNNYAMAFISYRDNFECYQCLRLPHFLKEIVVPVKYNSIIKEYSKKHKLDSALIFALIREESYFRPDAVSPANAYGLMQLLLRTARAVALNQYKKIYREDLFNPRLNIQLGMEYFKYLLDKYNQKIHLALAAYNAGDHRVDVWLSRFGNIPDEAFIEMIPFSDTRNYVKNILRNYYYYRFYYGASEE